MSKFNRFCIPKFPRVEHIFKQYEIFEFKGIHIIYLLQDHKIDKILPFFVYNDLFYTYTKQINHKISFENLFKAMNNLIFYH